MPFFHNWASLRISHRKLTYTSPLRFSESVHSYLCRLTCGPGLPSTCTPTMLVSWWFSSARWLVPEAHHLRVHRWSSPGRCYVLMLFSISFTALRNILTNWDISTTKGILRGIPATSAHSTLAGGFVIYSCPVPLAVLSLASLPVSRCCPMSQV